MNHLLKKSVFLFVFPCTVLATPAVNIDTQYYTIYGSTANELRKEMNAKSSVRHLGNTYDAHTHWFVNWHYYWNARNGQCYMTNVTSTVDVKFIFPLWINHNDSNYMLKDKWDRYYKALTLHENGHKDFGIKAAKEIESKVLKLSSSSTCHMLKQRANVLSKNIIDKYIALGKEYDEKTNHGTKDGAIFP